MIISRKYDILIIILIASLSFGLIGGSLQIPRVLAIAFLPVLIDSFRYVRNYVKPYLLCFIAFWSFGLLSMTWTPDFSQGMKELVYFPVHFLLFLEIIAFSRLAKTPTHAVSMGWMVAVCLTLVVALWEIATGHHLSLSVHQSNDYIHIGGKSIVRHYASVTFGNFNTYVTFLCFAFPFLLYRVSMIRGLKIKGLYPVLVVILSAVCILYNASRGGLISIVLMSAIYLRFNSTKRYALPLTVILVLTSFYVLYTNMGILEAVIARGRDGKLLEDSGRLGIWIAVWKAFAATYGLGVGMGGMQVAIAEYKTGINVAHNLFLEILLQYGIIFLSVFLFYLLQLFRKAQKINNISVKASLLMALFTMPVYGIIDSGYLLVPPIFVLLASLTVLADDERTQFLRRTIRLII